MTSSKKEKDIPDRHTAGLRNRKKESKMKPDEASVKSSNVTWSTKKKEIANRVEEISSKFEEIQRTIRPAGNISSSDSNNDGILDSPTRNQIIDEEIRKYELQIANNFPSPKVVTSEQKISNGQQFQSPGEKSSGPSPLPVKMRTSTKAVLNDLVSRLESIDDISSMDSSNENENAPLQMNKEIENIMTNKATNSGVVDSNISQPEWKRSVYKRDTALPLTSILPAEKLQQQNRVKEVSETNFGRKSPLDEVDSMYLIQEIHRFIGQAKREPRINKSEGQVKKNKKTKRRKDKKKKSKKKKDKKRDLATYKKDFSPNPGQFHHQAMQRTRPQHTTTLLDSKSIQEEQKNYMQEYQDFGDWY